MLDRSVSYQKTHNTPITFIGSFGAVLLILEGDEVDGADIDVKQNSPAALTSNSG